MNWSSAIIDTGVMSRQLKGTPVASGVVNRLDSVTTILCGSPLAPLTSRKPSAPAPPDLLTTTSGCFMRLCLATTPWIRRAIWSAPPPVPAGTTNPTGVARAHAPPGVVAASASAAAQKTLLMSSPSVGASGGHLDGDDAATDVRKLDLTAV